MVDMNTGVDGKDDLTDEEREQSEGVEGEEVL